MYKDCFPSHRRRRSSESPFNGKESGEESGRARNRHFSAALLLVQRGIHVSKEVPTPPSSSFVGWTERTIMYMRTLPVDDDSTA